MVEVSFYSHRGDMSFNSCNEGDVSEGKRRWGKLRKLRTSYFLSLKYFYLHFVTLKPWNSLHHLSINAFFSYFVLRVEILHKVCSIQLFYLFVTNVESNSDESKIKEQRLKQSQDWHEIVLRFLEIGKNTLPRFSRIDEDGHHDESK